MLWPVVMGCDPSSSKLAIVYGDDLDPEFVVFKFKAGPLNRPQACLDAYDLILALLREEMPILLGLEAPVSGKGGVGSVIPQAMVSGAVQAASARARVPVNLINVPHWKKTIIGNGGAGKPVVAQWVKDNHPEFYDRVRDDTPLVKGEPDQDVLDAFCIYLMTRKNYEINVKLSNRSKRRAATTA